MYLRRIHDTKAETFLVNEQLNAFDTTVDSLRESRYAERLPEATYRIIGEPIWDNRLIFTSESSATYFNGSFDQSDMSRLVLLLLPSPRQANQLNLSQSQGLIR